jgi:hypothetical protein
MARTHRTRNFKVMDPKEKKHLEPCKHFVRLLVEDEDMDETVKKSRHGKSCRFCARLSRGYRASLKRTRFNHNLDRDAA